MIQKRILLLWKIEGANPWFILRGHPPIYLLVMLGSDLARYLIDNYDELPSNIFFLHATRHQWHNDDPDYDGVAVLRRFQVPYLQERGYVNLRCDWSLGCPVAIEPSSEEPLRNGSPNTGYYYKQAFSELFPELQVPQEVGVPCCSQFAVTREQVIKHPRSKYEHIKNWLLDTKLPDDISGRILEYSWNSK